MEKYANLKELTKQFLHGSLSMIKMEYDNPKTTIVNIIYKDDAKYKLNYKIEVDNNTKKVKFRQHVCDYANDKIELKRYKQFETAVASYLFLDKEKTTQK
jgi:hypothetical protein